MLTIAVTRNFSVCPLLDINDPAFARWYGHGVWWALYGDYQGTGPYEDSYLITNVTHGISTGRYRDLTREHLVSTGFYLGMIHDGNIQPQTHMLRRSDTIVVLTDPDFAKGYEAGRDAPRDVSDTLFMQSLHACTSEHPLSYELGTMIGALSRAIIPATFTATLMQ